MSSLAAAAAIACAVLGAGTAAGGAPPASVCRATSSTLPPGTWLSEGGGRGDIILTCVRPKVIAHTGDSAATSWKVTAIRWSSWGGATATGAGVAVGCRDGACVRVPATVVAAGRARLSTIGCGPGRFHYSALRLRTTYAAQTVRTPIPQCTFTD